MTHARAAYEELAVGRTFYGPEMAIGDPGRQNYLVASRLKLVAGYAV